MSDFKRNYIVLHDGSYYKIFERLSKNIPFEAYNPEKHLGMGLSFNEAVSNCDVPKWQIEDTAYEVVFNG